MVVPPPPPTFWGGSALPGMHTQTCIQPPSTAMPAQETRPVPERASMGGWIPNFVSPVGTKNKTKNRSGLSQHYTGRGHDLTRAVLFHALVSKSRSG